MPKPLKTTLAGVARKVIRPRPVALQTGTTAEVPRTGRSWNSITSSRLQMLPSLWPSQASSPSALIVAVPKPAFQARSPSPKPSGTLMAKRVVPPPGARVLWNTVFSSAAASSSPSTKSGSSILLTRKLPQPARSSAAQ